MNEKKYYCNFCKKNFRTGSGFSTHLNLIHKINYIEYGKKYLNFPEEVTCKCGKFTTKLISSWQLEGINCKDCFKKWKDSMSEETRTKISSGLLKAFEEKRAVGWKSQKSKSYPEKVSKDLIEQVINKDELWQMVEELPLGRFRIDFAWPSKKIGIEIDGGQHFRYKNFIRNDALKNAYLKSLGWSLYRVSSFKVLEDYTSFKRLIKHIFVKEDIGAISICHYVLLHSGEEIDKTGLLILNSSESEIIKVKNSIDRKIEVLNVNSLKKITRINFVLTKEILLAKSGIDFSKRGWVQKASNIIGITPQKTRAWIKKELPTFYKENIEKN